MDKYKDTNRCFSIWDKRQHVGKFSHTPPSRHKYFHYCIKLPDMLIKMALDLLDCDTVQIPGNPKVYYKDCGPEIVKYNFLL